MLYIYPWVKSTTSLQAYSHIQEFQTPHHPWARISCSVSSVTDRFVFVQTKHILTHIYIFISGIYVILPILCASTLHANTSCRYMLRHDKRQLNMDEIERVRALILYKMNKRAVAKTGPRKNSEEPARNFHTFLWCCNHAGGFRKISMWDYVLVTWFVEKNISN